MANTKVYVLDTNVLIHDPEAIFRFQDNDLVIPIFVVEEIDQFKREGTERGRNCRQICRTLDSLRESSANTLSQGVPLGEGLGTLRIVVPAFHDTNRGDSLDHGAQDRAILTTALMERDSDRTRPTIFVTMDTNLRIRADAVGMEAENYEHSRTKTETSGSVTESVVPATDINDFFEDGHVDTNIQDMRPNASVLLCSDVNLSQTALARYDSKRKNLVQLNVPKKGVMGIRPKNKEQAFALDLLLDDSITLVTLMGKAGTGKTLLAIAAGLLKVTEENAYTKLLVSRPVMPLGRDIGFLPGSVDEKLNPWMQPIFDNLEFLFGGKKDEYAGLINSGVIGVEPLTYIRGRSLPNQYLIVDEAQNLTPHEIKTIITRAGEGSKIVLTGDPDQIDNPYVDAASNGLSVVTDRFREQMVAGHVILTKGERSMLAELASNLL